MPGRRHLRFSVVLPWLRHINSWDLDIMSWPRDFMLRDQHIFLVAMSLMRKQTYVTIATRDYQRLIKTYLLTLNI